MKHKELILASKSPRRKELLENCGIPFRIMVCDEEELFDFSLSAETAIEQIALQKAQSISKQNPQAIVLGCDTMVIVQDVPLGKPKDRADASRMLHMLCGNTHQVISAVAIVQGDTIDVFHEITEVTFYEADEDLLQMYLDSEEPYDKAGAYGIQGLGKLLVKEIHGDYYTVMGLPIAKLYRKLKHYEL